MSNTETAMSHPGKAMNKIPYVHHLEGRDALQALAETPARWATLLDAATPEEIETPPAPGKWCLREIVAHMADCELVWAWRLRYVLGEPQPVIQPFDQDSWAKPYASYTLAEARATYASVRAWNLTLIASLSDEDKRKPYAHPERGDEVLWNLVEIMAGHDLHHLKLLGH